MRTKTKQRKNIQLECTDSSGKITYCIKIKGWKIFLPIYFENRITETIATETL